MSTNYGTIERIAREIGRALQPLQDRLQSGDVIAFFTELGVEFPPALTTFTAFTNSLSAAVGTATTIPNQLLDLETAIQTDNYPQIYTKLNTLISTVTTLKGQISQISTQLNALQSSLTGLTAQQVSAFATALLKKMLDYTLVVYMEGYNPVVVNLLSWVGLVKYTPHAGTPGNPNDPPYKQREILWSNIGPLLTNTGPYLAGLYDWGSPTYDGDKLLKAIHDIMSALSLPHQYKPKQISPAQNASVDFLFFTLEPKLPASGPKGLALKLKKDYTGGGPFEIPFIFDNWKLSFAPKSNLLDSSEITFMPGGILKATAPTGQITGDISIDLIGHDPTKKMLIFGKSSGSRLEADTITFGFDGYFLWNGSQADGEFGFHLEFKDATLLIQTGDADSFLQKVLPSNGWQADFNLIFGWRSDKGFYIEGSGALELELPIHKTLLNAITVDSATIGIEADNADLAASIGFSGSLKLGPFTAVVQNVGIKANIDFPPGGGNIGPANATMEFKPPTGLGLSVKSDTFTGGGFLSFDQAQGRYVGALELSVKKKIAIKAIGILTTKLPGGQSGYSLLLLISAEFQPIQLGFGFTLNGVGGLIALHRRMNKQALVDGVRNNSLDDILFPKDPVANINSIISSLEKAFPIDEDRFTFGPMAIIGWGTPTLITAELGLFIEVPDPVQIALIGVIRALLPSETNALVRLQINFAGTIDFEAKFITFDARLFDSALLGRRLDGDMAFRLRWGANPGFALSIGGFYPGFQMPGFDLPSMNRLSLTLYDGNPRLIISMYFAVTSNTVQFGASADFYFKVSGKLNIDGNVGFDVLIRFAPFHFTGMIKGGLSVNWKGNSLMGLWFEGTLDGPTPWQLNGSVSFKILRIEYDVDFSKRWGDEQVTSRPDLDVINLLNPALIDPKNWQTTLPENFPQLVTIRDLSAATGIVVHPHGKMAVNQKVTPLDFTLQHYGNKNLLKHHRFSIDIMDPGNPSNALSKTPLQEYFSPGEILELSESQKLSYPSFELYNSGVQVQNTNDAFTAGSAYYEMLQEYEQAFMDQPHVIAHYNGNIQFTASQQSRLVNNNSTGNSPIGVQQKNASLFAPPAASVQQNTYAIAQTYDRSTYNGYTANSKAEAQVMLNELLAQNPALEGKLDVVHSFETF